MCGVALWTAVGGGSACCGCRRGLGVIALLVLQFGDHCRRGLAVTRVILMHKNGSERLPFFFFYIFGDRSSTSRFDKKNLFCIVFPSVIMSENGLLLFLLI